MKPRPSEHEKNFWRLATFAIKNGYIDAREAAIIARLQPSRKSWAWARHLKDLKWLMSRRSQQQAEDDDRQLPLHSF
jgi:hypothetical protein